MTLREIVKLLDAKVCIGDNRLDEEVEYAFAGRQNTQRAHIEARTFGNFDLLVDGKPVPFKQAKCKELLAYLIDRRGSGVSDDGPPARAFRRGRLRKGDPAKPSHLPRRAGGGEMKNFCLKILFFFEFCPCKMARNVVYFNRVRDFERISNVLERRPL